MKLNKKLLYIHGFASDGNSSKARKLKEIFGEENVLCPSLPIEPLKAINLLNNLFKPNNYNLLPIGTSLGGFYSWWLCNYQEVYGIQINPLVDPLDMQMFIGENKFLNKNETFIFKEEYINDLLFLKNRLMEISYSNLNLFLSKNDEILYINKTLKDKCYKYCEPTYLDDNHRVDNIEPIIERIKLLL